VTPAITARYKSNRRAGAPADCKAANSFTNESDLEEARTRDHDACNERENARKQHDIDDEVGHG
jgi:hypothetical protein